MTGGVRIDGAWPAPITLTRGWARARARPWNDHVPEAMLRLERGSHDFLERATEEVGFLASGVVVSAPLHPRSTRVWRRAGYDLYARLTLMECSLLQPPPAPEVDVVVEENPDWDAILEVDRQAFHGFWRMGRHGYREAMSTTSRAAVLVVSGQPDLAGFAIVGSQWGVSYLQRVAVHPDNSGRGLGSALVRSAQLWGRHHGAGMMMLNVRPENTAARALYDKEGFTATRSPLQIMWREV